MITELTHSVTNAIALGCFSITVAIAMGAASIAISINRLRKDKEE